jgi:hypothetical protein
LSDRLSDGLHLTQSRSMVRKDDATRVEDWHVGLFEAPCVAPQECCLACFCPPCYSYQQRLALVGSDIVNYKCCNGAYGDCSCGGDNCGQICLGAEVLCCFWCSIFGNRVTIQNRYHIRNTPFENFIFMLACILSWIRFIVKLFVNIPFEPQLICDCIYLALSGCMQSQQQIEIDHRTKHAHDAGPLLAPDPINWV